MDLMSLVDPVLTSPLLYPLLAGLSSLDGVLPMIPSEAAVVTAGVYAHAGTPSLPLVVVVTALGVFVGDHLAYGLSRSVLGPRLIGRSRHVGRAVAAASRRLDRRAGLLIVMSRFLPGGRVTMNAACCSARLPLARLSPASAVAALAWATYVAGLGFLAVRRSWRIRCSASPSGSGCRSWWRASSTCSAGGPRAAGSGRSNPR